MMTMPTNTIQGPHQGQPVLAAGELLDHARVAMVMLHGRGARAEDILTLAADLAQPGFAYLAPQAAGNTWYPNCFLAPIPSNEPWLSSGLAAIADVSPEWPGPTSRPNAPYCWVSRKARV